MRIFIFQLILSADKWRYFSPAAPAAVLPFAQPQVLHSCWIPEEKTHADSTSRHVQDGGSAPHLSTAHLWAAVLASSTPPPCIQLRTFMPPSGSSFRLLPLLWMLSWIPNINKPPKLDVCPSVSRPLSSRRCTCSPANFKQSKADALYAARFERPQALHPLFLFLLS